jgi:NAD+ synthase
VAHNLKKRGVVLGVSGGIDSSVTLALCVEAFGPKRVLVLMLPEHDSNPESEDLATTLAKRYGVEYLVENISDALVGFKCYERRDEAIQRIFPEYTSEYKAKITLSSDLLEKDTLNIFNINIISPSGEEKSKRIPIKEYLQIVAASNFKQRSRMCMLYYHAEARNYAVIGTGNKNEHEQGFFVKWGDGGTDIKPIAHLFKTQVYQLGEYFGMPDEIQNRVPTTDTYSAEQTQEEFFFRMPFEILDTIWYGWENGIPSAEIAKAIDLEPEQVDIAIADIKRKKATTEYLRMNPL